MRPAGKNGEGRSLLKCSISLLLENINDFIPIIFFNFKNEKKMIMARQSSSYLKKHAFLVALNKKIYEGEYLNQIILPYEQQFRRINIIQYKNIISKYTADPDILSIILISVNKRKARSMYLQLKEKGILDISSL